MTRRRFFEYSDWIRKCRANDDEKYRHLLLKMWTAVDRKITELEDIRDRDAPKNYDDECKKTFCDAVRILPELREFGKELWYEYSGKEVNGIG